MKTKSQFDNYNIYIKLAISIDTHFLHFRSISNGYFFFFLKNWPFIEKLLLYLIISWLHNKDLKILISMVLLQRKH